MRGYRIRPPASAFTQQPRRRRPRQHARKHLAWIRTLPCAICGRRGDIHAAHLRAASLQFGKFATGLGEKPDDSWTAPLCADHHLFGEEAQHQGRELAFWGRHAINPFALALALWHASGDDERGFLILEEFRRRGNNPPNTSPSPPAAGDHG